MQKVIFDKVCKIMAGEAVIMSDKELDWLDENQDEETKIFYVSAPNPNQLGTLDRWLVAKNDHPYMVAFRDKQNA